jgi:hypothetical protein
MKDGVAIPGGPDITQDDAVFAASVYSLAWTKLDAYRNTEQIVAGGKKLYQRHKYGEAFVYSGTPLKWTKLDSSSRTIAIAASR